MRRVLGVVAVVAAVAGMTDHGWAQAGGAPGGYRVRVGPGHGTHLTFSSNFYDPVARTITINATVSPRPPGVYADYVFYFNGIGLTPGFVPGNRWGASINLPVAREFTSIVVQIPIRVEFVHLASGAVYGRDRAVLWDERQGGMETHYGPDRIEAEVGAQLTAGGLDAIEPLHQAAMPAPSLAGFNAALSSAAANQRQTTFPTTEPRSNSDSDVNNACVPVSSLPRAFTGLDAYRDALTDADISYTTYLGALAVKAGENTAQNFVTGAALLAGGPVGWFAAQIGFFVAEQIVDNYLDAECVRQPPSSADFEVCVGEVSGTMTDLDIGSVTKVDLKMGAQRISADVTLGNVDGTVTGSLNRLFVRWAKGPASCTVFPQKTIDPFALTTAPDVREWATCTGLVARASTASTLDTTDPSVTGAISPSFTVQGNGEALTVTQTGDAAFEFGSSRSQVTDVGACGDPAIEPWVGDVLAEFYPSMATALNEVWNDGSPNTGQAQALDSLLSALETGGNEPQDLSLDSPFFDLDINPRNVLANTEPHGLYTAWSPDVLQLFPGPLTPSGWMYPQPPWRDPIAPSAPGVQLWFPYTDRDPKGNPFHLAFTLTSGALNQHIRERYLAPAWKLTGRFRPTFQDFGAPAPPGRKRRDEVPLTGNSLGLYLHPAFTSFGNTRFRIVMRPTMMPFTWIPPEPPQNTPPGETPIVYHMYQYQIDFIASAPGDPNPRKLRVLVDFLDSDFDLNLNASNNLLTPAFGNRGFGFTILESRMSGCPLVALSAGPSCEVNLRDAIAALFRPRLERTLLGMLADFPAPLKFDAGGGGVTFLASTVSTYTDYQMRTFFMNLVQQ